MVNEIGVLGLFFVVVGLSNIFARDAMWLLHGNDPIPVLFSVSTNSSVTSVDIPTGIHLVGDTGYSTGCF